MKINSVPRGTESITEYGQRCYDAGRKEVVEWLINYNLHQFPEEYRILWQAKLQEWGIE